MYVSTIHNNVLKLNIAMWKVITIENCTTFCYSIECVARILFTVERQKCGEFLLIQSLSKQNVRNTAARSERDLKITIEVLLGRIGHFGYNIWNIVELLLHCTVY